MYANPQRCPAIFFINTPQGEVQLLTSRQEIVVSADALPASTNAAVTAAWTRTALEKQLPVPQALR